MSSCLSWQVSQVWAIPGLTLVFDWTRSDLATSVVVLVFVRVRSGASAQLSGAVSVENPDTVVRLSADYNSQQYVIYWLSN